MAAAAGRAAAGRHQDAAQWDGGGRHGPGCGAAGRLPVSTRRREAPRLFVPHLGCSASHACSDGRGATTSPSTFLSPAIHRSSSSSAPLPPTACVVVVRSGGPLLAGAARHHGRKDDVLLLEI